MQELVCAPRLSGRLLSHLYGEQVRVSTKEDLSRELIRREASLRKGSDRSSNVEMSSFAVDMFLDAKASSQSNDEVQKLYRQFLGKVTKITQNDPDQHSARTLYRIISKAIAKDRAQNVPISSLAFEQSRKDASSFFGFIPQNIFSDIVRDVEQLESYRLAKESTSKGISDSISFEYGASFQFRTPEVVYTEREIRFASNQSAEVFMANFTGGQKNQNEEIQTQIVWFLSACESFLSSNPEAQALFPSALLLAKELKSVISSSLQTNRSELDEATLQIKLFDLFGENGFDFIQLLFERLDYLIFIANEKIDFAKSVNETNPTGEEKASLAPNHAPSATMRDYDKLSANQKRKLEKKEQQELEAALLASQQEAALGNNVSTGSDWLRRAGFSEEYILQERALGLQKGSAFTTNENWRDNLAPAGTLEYHEKKGLPVGAEKKTGVGYEEVFIPAAKKLPVPEEGALVDISSLEPWAAKAFPNTKKLNRIQSAVFKCAYSSTENMLVCAPTGAGKTNIAMLTFLRLVKSHILFGDTIDKAAVKAVYIAPMKALAQEVVTKFSERLTPLGLVVREFTGDMQLTRQEVAESHLLVCTPEKYDVVTRKGGDGSLGTMVSLLIIDEARL